MTKLTASELDRLAEEYYLNGAIADVDIEERAQRWTIDPVVDAVRSARSVVELGFGTGQMTAALLAAGVPIEVVEGSSVLAARARALHPGLVVHESLFEEFGPREPVDAVLALHVLEHVDDPAGMAAHLASWLRPGGVVVAVTPNAESIHRRVAVAMGLQERLDTLSGRDHLVGHRRVYDLDGLCADLRAGGLEPVRVFGAFVKPLANAQMLDWSPELLDGFNRIARDLPASLCANIGVVSVRPA